jgi:hypothetical protein
MEHKLIMEGWRDWLDTAKGVANKFAEDFVASITTPVDAYQLSKREAKRLYPVPSKVDLAIRDPKEIRDLQDNAYRAEAFQHICASFMWAHRSKRIFSGFTGAAQVRKVGYELEKYQMIIKRIKGTYDPDDRKRDLIHNEIGLGFAEEYKDRSGLKFEDYSKIVQEFISTGEFFTSSSTKEGNVRTHNELLAKRAKYKDQLPTTPKKLNTMVAPYDTKL